VSDAPYTQADLDEDKLGLAGAELEETESGPDVDSV